MASPNENLVTARVIKIERSAQWPNKWLLLVEVVDSKNVHGAQFVKAGQQVEAFAFGAEAPARISEVIRASAEYIGDARSGQLKLFDIVSPRGQAGLRGIIRFRDL